jgi:hypothetical protein
VFPKHRYHPRSVWVSFTQRRKPEIMSFNVLSKLKSSRKGCVNCRRVKRVATNCIHQYGKIYLKNVVFKTSMVQNLSRKYCSVRIVKNFFTILISSKPEQTASHPKKKQFFPVHISKKRSLS